MMIKSLISEIKRVIEMIKVRKEVRKVTEQIHSETLKRCPNCGKHEIALARIRGSQNGYLVTFRCLACDFHYEIEISA